VDELDEEDLAREEAERFEELVEEALENFPEEWAARLDNVDVVVEPEPARQTLRDMGIPYSKTLLGLYQGIPQTQRNTSYGAVMPDRIVVYRGPILDEADQECPRDGDFEAAVRRVIRKTVLHEIGHHFGLSDDDLKRLHYD
jgi:predicted Zn-dependent protease with MMP-like domain